MKKREKLLSLLLILALCMSALPWSVLAMEYAQQSLMRGVVNAQAGTVVGIVPPETMEIGMASKLPLDEVLEAMPTSLQMKVQGYQELVEIPVEWYCISDYEEGNDYYYQFSPAWDMVQFPLAEELSVERDAPYIAVYLFEPSAMNGVPTTANRVTRTGNADIIFNYLTGEMKLNSAVACGILANIYCESSLNPKSTCLDTNGKTSYGLCHWNGSRYTNLKKWCSQNGFDYTTIKGQLNFLNHELNTSAYHSILTYLQGVKNTAQGAYDAAYHWCYYYEQPNKKESHSIERGNLSQYTYWVVYGLAQEKGEPTPNLSDQTIPNDSMEYGTFFSVKGNVYCSNVLTNVTAGVYDSTGASATSKSAEPNDTVYNLAEMDSALLFSQLNAGVYHYRVTASTQEQTVTLLEQQFTVVPRNISDAAINVLGTDSETGSSIISVTYGKTTLQEGKDYHIVSRENGACTVQGMGNYIGAVEATLIEETTQSTAPDETQQNNLVIELEKEGETPAILALSGESLPTNQAFGTYFTLKGTVSCDKPIEEVSAGVYDTNNKGVTTASIRSNSKMVSLFALDSEVLFSRVPVGKNYTYRVTATVDNQTTTLIEQHFDVSTCEISQATLSLKSKVKYTGKSKKPTPKLTYHGMTLQQNKDYTVSYTNNCDVGTATCVIEGKGAFTGTIQKTFEIVK